MKSILDVGAAMDMLGAHIQTIKEIEDKLTGKR